MCMKPLLELINDNEKLGEKLSDEDKEKIEEIVNEKISWLEENQEAEAEDFKAQKKELEDTVQPIIAKLYQGAGGAPPPGGEEEEEDYDRDELWFVSPQYFSTKDFSHHCWLVITLLLQSVLACQEGLQPW